MDSAARLPQNPTARLTGIGIACVVHVAVILALSQGLMNTKTNIPAKPPTIDLLKDPVTPPPPLQRPHPDPVRLDDPPPPLWQAPIIDEVNPPILTNPAPRPSEETEVRPTGPVVVARADIPPPARTGMQSVGAVCTKTIAPTMPATSFAGDAVFRVIAGTHAGRVTSVEIQALSGGMDMRSQRAFKAAIESALRDGYECASDMRFTQEFHFRVE